MDFDKMREEELKFIRSNTTKNDNAYELGGDHHLRNLHKEERLKVQGSWPQVSTNAIVLKSTTQLLCLGVIQIPFELNLSAVVALDIPCFKKNDIVDIEESGEF
jgi:hypothetical protein